MIVDAEPLWKYIAAMALLTNEGASSKNSATNIFDVFS